MCVQRFLMKKKKYRPSIPIFLSQILSTDSQHGEDIWSREKGSDGGSLSRSLGTHARKKKCQKGSDFGPPTSLEKGILFRVIFNA